MDKSITKELRAFYDKFIKIYSSSDESIVDLFSDNISVIGGSTHFVMKTIAHFTKEIRKDFFEAPGKIDIITRFFSTQNIAPDVYILTALNDWKIPIGNDIFSVFTRLVFVVKRTSKYFKINHFSVSAPLKELRNGEYFPLKEMEKRNSILEEKVAEKTDGLLKEEENEKRSIMEMVEQELANIKRKKIL